MFTHCALACISDAFQLIPTLDSTHMKVPLCRMHVKNLTKLLFYEEDMFMYIKLFHDDNGKEDKLFTKT